jgi:hypothetical protein
MGDLVAVLDAGAYGFAMSSQYNGRPRCPEVLVRGGGTAAQHAAGNDHEVSEGQRWFERMNLFERRQHGLLAVSSSPFATCYMVDPLQFSPLLASHRPL